MAVAQILVREAEPLRAKQKRHRARPQLLAYKPGARFKPSDGMLQFPVTDRRRPHHQRAIGHSLGHAGKLLRGRKNPSRSPNRRTRLAKCPFVRVHHPQTGEAEIAHGPRRGANVERIARRHQDNP